MKTIGIGIVGCGRISDMHALGYRDREDAKIIAVCDTNRRRARKKAKEWGAEEVYKDYAELLANPKIDLVELVVPHHPHKPMTVQAAQAGKHISVQKPMALTAAEADQMITATAP
ncbi:MAG: Gfo/Idh/MocA family oxidoreductase [Chloroflexota bacterium]|jgi:predicted dehydrogenase|nr:Gfo/Idh/MocA family oxidoreductase [Chloroflexota bacterium]